MGFNSAFNGLKRQSLWTLVHFPLLKIKNYNTMFWEQVSFVSSGKGVRESPTQWGLNKGPKDLE